MPDSAPPELDIPYYRDTNADLAGFDDAALATHFVKFGAAEGRPSAPAAYRAGLIANAEEEASILEIGPFCNPVIRGRQVRYFDVLDTEQLIERAREQGYKFQKAPKIDFVSPLGDLSVVDRTFDAAISAHCIEHQPDLVRHLKQVADLLNPGGRYYLIVPDQRYCFDHFIAPSTLAGVVEAHHAGRMRHRLASVIEHRALTTHNDQKRHWAGDHLDKDYFSTIASRTEAALAEYDGAGEGYIDVHAWQFTPESLRAIMAQLAKLYYSPFDPSLVFATPSGKNEFTAVLTKRG